MPSIPEPAARGNHASAAPPPLVEKRQTRALAGRAAAASRRPALTGLADAMLPSMMALHVLLHGRVAWIGSALLPPRCSLRPGQPAAYGRACNESTTPAACASLNLTCTWGPLAAESCELKPGAPAAYKSACESAKTKQACDGLSRTCEWTSDGPPPPGPPGPTPPPPPPAPPPSGIGCQLRPGQPPVYSALCASANQKNCDGPLYEHVCYWASPAPKPAASCLGWMQKSGCGSATSEEACQICMAGRAANTQVLEPSCTGTCYACAVADFGSFCAQAPLSPAGNATGCQMRPGQPAPFATLCASRTSESACGSDLYVHTCYWASPPVQAPASCEGLLEKSCSGQDVGALALARAGPSDPIPPRPLLV
jgi:hypothetical protein